MIRLALYTFLALFFGTLTALAGGSKDKVKSGSVDEQFLALRKEYQMAIKTAEGNDGKKHKIAVAYAPKFLALATKHAKEEGAADALLWIPINAPRSAELPKAVRLLEKEYHRGNYVPHTIKSAVFVIYGE